MNSPFANIYNAIIEEIKTKLTGDDAIRYIDHDLGQLETYNATTGKPSVSFPCLLIDFEDFKFDGEGENTQRAEGIVLLRLGFDAITPTNNLTPTIYREKGLSIYDKEWQLHKVLQGWSPGDGFGYFTRERATTEKREDNHKVRAIRYRLSFKDNSTLLPLQSGTAPINVVPGSLH